MIRPVLLALVATGLLAGIAGGLMRAGVALFAATALGAALAWRHRYGARRTEGIS